ncbi:PIR protein [Plasmodium yoelii]|uniref:PIR protein n=2 Tax=Plasmodium yoelii TaxID=5861 RepID=A0AAE9WQF9_PLAYO|nr:PIR protein [Plasmodium yoelii]WBY55172.1 PIR protein [Plasmodium yoelii yoelii]CDS44295.1 YIR protein [Plasmodium yoelii]VTZ73075.1 PIR protein [Plasmodium yoelii]|eukprot:XP_022810873.1 PIR protein [Plasmodium yoelii]
MNYTMCKRFDTLRSFLPDDLNKSTNLNFKSLGNFMKYCSNGKSEENECKTDLDKIKGGCLWLFEQLFVKNKNSINMAEYIIIWLSYMLNQKTHEGINNLNDFYTKHIENNTYYNQCDNDGQDCSDKLKNNTEYTNYKEIIDKKINFMAIGINDMSKFYGAFKSLCKMYTEIGGEDTQNKKYLENSKNFVKKYDELNVSDITKDSAYYQALSTLSSDYNNYKNYCKDNKFNCDDIQPLSPINIKENSVQDSGHISEVTSSSSSITSKLIPILSIIVAIPIFLGIFYKYSLFGFRKRPQKQHLREKIKK